MLRALPTLEKLIRQLQRVPYLASKNIYRVALYFLQQDIKQVEQFCAVVLEAKKKLVPCLICFNWAELDNKCFVCSQLKRDTSVICVVETWHDLLAIEKTSSYQGVYHMLGGVLCPLEGIGVDDLHIAPLLTRLKDRNIKEVIFATNPTPEGEATASFIASKLRDTSIVISRLASGVPVGSSLEYMDRVTIFKALTGRRPF